MPKVLAYEFSYHHHDRAGLVVGDVVELAPNLTRSVHSQYSVVSIIHLKEFNISS